MGFIEELQQHLDRAAREREGAPVGQLLSRIKDASWRDVSAYAREIRATREVAPNRWKIRARLSAIGEAFLNLKGRDAVRWLLHVEVAQSRGRSDPFRLSVETVSTLLRFPERTIFSDSLRDIREIFKTHFDLYSWDTIERLSELDVIKIIDERDPVDVRDEAVGYSLLPSGQSILEELAGVQDTQMWLLTKALLNDETVADLTKIVTSEGMARQARMVLHEIRNALQPIEGLVQDLRRAKDGPGLDAAEAGHIYQRLDRSLSRINQFLRNQLQVAAEGVPAQELFDVAAAIRDAIASLNGDAHLVSFAHPPDLPPSMGTRQRFVLAVVNLLRNAFQSVSGKSAEVKIEIGVQETYLIISVDDNGPGIPEEKRKMVFVKGYSTRPGGTGEGLTLVREVVVNELQGDVTCEDSPAGGARFLMRLPMRRRG